MTRSAPLFVALLAGLSLTACEGELLYDSSGPVPDPVDGADAAPDNPDPDPVPTESLSITFETSTLGGQYAPRNVVAVWIETEAGQFVRTVGRWANVRRSHLVAWTAASGSDVDAVSGATRPNHTGTLTATWDGTDVASAAVPDGSYVVRIEVCEDNSNTPAQNNQGSFPFDKNGQASNNTLQGTGIQNVVLDYSGRP